MDTPQATLPQAPTIPAAPAPGMLPRLLDAGRGASWWGEGWRVFTASPGLWIGMLIVLLLILCVLAVIPILGQLALPLLMPVFAGGLLLGCHALAKGQPMLFGHLFAGFKDGRAGPLMMLGFLGLVFNVLIALIIGAVLFATAGTSVFALASSSMEADPAVIGKVLKGLGLALAIIIPLAVILVGLLAMMYWFAAPLITLNRMSAWTAMKTSLAGCWSNLGALMVYGLIYIGLAIVASIPFGLGWLVLAPVMVGSWYAGWREIFGE
jgi:uncharacterized membrane protein